METTGKEGFITPLIGQEYLAGDSDWARLGPVPGQVVEFDMSRSSLTLIEEGWASILVTKVAANEDGGLMLLGELIAMEDIAAKEDMLAEFGKENTALHVCPVTPCSSVVPGEHTIHLGNLRVWDGGSFHCDFFLPGGRKALKSWHSREKSKERPEKVHEEKKRKRAPAADPSSKRKPRESGARSSGTPKSRKDKKKEGVGEDDPPEVGADERRKLRERLEEVKRRVHGQSVVAEVPAGGRSPRNFDSAPGLRTAATLDPKRSVLATSPGTLAIKDGDMRSSKRKRSKTGRGSPGDLLLAQAVQQDGKSAKTQRGKKKEKGQGQRLVKLFSALLEGRKKKKRKKKKEKKRRKDYPGDSDPEDGDDSEDEESESEEVEESSESYGSSTDSELKMEAPLRKKAIERPGSVMQQLVRQAAHHLDQKAVVDTEEAEGSLVGGVRIATYFNLLIRPYHQASHPMVRELYSLSQVIDHLRSGLLAQAADGLAGRFIAVHQALEDGNWSAAAALEMYPLEQPSSASTSTLLMAQKHRRLLQKSQGYQPFGKGRGSYHRGKGGWSGQDQQKGDYKGKSKKGKGKGGGWNQKGKQEDWWKDETGKNQWKERQADAKKGDS